MTTSVLIADDEKNIALALQVLMSRAGYAVSVVHDGEAALQRTRATRPDLLVLDVAMARRSGYEVCRLVRADPALSDTRIIMITARGEAASKKGLALGADACFVKPFSIADLNACVRDLLSRQPGGR